MIKSCAGSKRLDSTGLVINKLKSHARGLGIGIRMLARTASLLPDFGCKCAPSQHDCNEYSDLAPIVITFYMGKMRRRGNRLHGTNKVIPLQCPKNGKMKCLPLPILVLATLLGYALTSSHQFNYSCLNHCTVRSYNDKINFVKRIHWLSYGFSGLSGHHLLII